MNRGGAGEREVDKGYRRLFTEAKLTENGIEKVLGRGFAHHLANRLHGDAEVDGNEFERGTGAQGLERPGSGGACSPQRILVACIDCHFVHVGSHPADPDLAHDGLLQILDPLPCQGTDRHPLDARFDGTGDDGRQV